MSNGLSRRAFLVGGAAIGFTLASDAMGQGTAPQKPPAVAGDLVKEFVIAGHGNLERVKEMLAAHPELLNASWDWGGGDFESALEGAGHMGHREIAEFLIGKGARMNVFQAAMLGELDVVKAMLARHPALKESKGPHGIPLLAHAKAGKADGVVAFLEGR